MSDANQIFFQQASDLLSKIEIRYMEADFDQQIELKPERDRAIALFSQAQLAILRTNIICTDADVQKMKQLRQQIASSPDFVQVLVTIASFVSFVRSRFLI